MLRGIKWQTAQVEAGTLPDGSCSAEAAPDDGALAALGDPPNKPSLRLFCRAFT